MRIRQRHWTWIDMDPMKVFVTDSEKTFQYDDDLPSLPLPPLHQTLQKYLESVRPHVSVGDYENTENIVRRFEHGVGASLYRKLVDKTKNSQNWLERWWDTAAYLDNRAPTPTVNFGGPTPFMYHSFPAREGIQMEVAGLLTYYTLKYWKLLREEKLRPERDRNGCALTMHQYRRLFSTCQIPGVKTDSMKYYFSTESEGRTPVHLLVMCKGRLFTFDVVDEKEELLSPLEYRKQLQNIKDKCDAMPEGPGLGSLTGDNRTSWAHMRSRLLALHPENHVAMETVQSSVMAIVLDDYSPVDETDMVQQLLAGDCVNRWFDKSFSWIVHKNGLVTSNCDHTPMEAMVLVSLTYFVDLSVMKCRGKWQGSEEIREMPDPTELVFHIDDIILRGISSAREEYLKYANNLECSCLTFKQFGKDFLRHNKVHPDAFVQMALQFTYYRKYGCPAPTYETATTRRFWHARTETLRSCSMEAIDWCKAMLDDRILKQNKLQLFVRAVENHLKLMGEATKNHGCDRLLLGLSIQAQEDGLATPDIFLDPAYVKSGGGGNYKLSTSFLGYTTVFGCVAPMCTNGYGSFYKIEASQIGSCVTAWKSDMNTSASGFHHLLHQTMAEMGSMFDNPVNMNAQL